MKGRGDSERQIVFGARDRRIDVMNADPVRRPFDHMRPAQRLQCLVGMDDRKADGVGDLRLGQGNVEIGAARHAGCATAQEEKQGKVGDAFACAAPADRNQMLVQRAFLARREPRHVKAKPGMNGEEFEEPLALENAGPRFRDGLDAVEQRVLHRALQADHIAGKKVS